MITPPPGTRVWLAAGATDMRKGFDGLAMLVQDKLRRDPFGGQIFVFRGAVDICSKRCGGTDKGSACLPSGWRRVALFGPRRRTALQHSRRRNSACCWKASIGGCRCARGGRRPPDSRDFLTRMRCET